VRKKGSRKEIAAKQKGNIRETREAAGKQKRNSKDTAGKHGKETEKKHNETRSKQKRNRR